VSIEYKVVRPPLGLHFIGPDRGYPDKPRQVWTQGEDEFARYWFPCHDAPHDRTTTEMIVRVPRGFTAISNGRLVRKAARGREALFHWKQEIPHATYLVTLAVGEFSEIKETWRGKPVLYYVPKGREDDARRAFGQTPKMMEFFSRKIGVPYAYPKYAQVAALDFIFGGMENTSATTQTALTLHDERAHLDFSSDPLVAHELAHQWFGDLLDLPGLVPRVAQRKFRHLLRGAFHGVRQRPRRIRRGVAQQRGDLFRGGPRPLPAAHLHQGV
jgi:aminopeptidase N